jgi:glycosyltransferase involved in cell wall biosynthesis
MLSPHPNVRSPLTKITPLLADALAGMGCEVVCEPWGRRSDQERMTSKFLTRFADTLRVRRTLSDGRFDALVVHTSHDRISLLRDVPLLLAVRRVAPCIALHLHGGHSEWLLAPGRYVFKYASRPLFSLSDGVLVLSTTQKRELERFAPSATVRVVLNPFLPTGNGHEIEFVHNELPVVVFASRLMATKGIFDLLEAAALLRQRLQFRLVVAGSGPDAASVAAKVDALGLRDDVVLPGYLEADRLAGLFRSADVFVLPTYDSEGFPTVVAEAMSAGLPIVATRNRGIVDYVQDGVNALLVADRAPHEIAEALDRVLRDDALRARMSAANLEKVEMFAPERAAKQYLSTLHELTASLSARAGTARG